MKAIALVSGGLDSTLAARLVKEQGIEVLVLNLKTPFCLCDRKTSAGCFNEAAKVAKELGTELKLVNATDDFFQILKNPKHGFGSNMNPCIDCRILLLRKAGEFMQEVGAAFIVTGEVLGQRPMSQHRRAMRVIEKEAGLEGLVLRPLSAKILPETLPEKKGWVSRGKLLGFNGRSRKPQIDLARQFGIKDYPCAAGGCLLTDPRFAKKTKDLLQHEGLDINNVKLLKMGRHFRLSPDAKLAVGRNKQENEILLNLAKKGDYLFSPDGELLGPTALGRGKFSEELIRLACSITCRYCDLNGDISADICYRKISRAGFFRDSPLRSPSNGLSLGDSPCLKVSPLDEARLVTLRI